MTAQQDLLTVIDCAAYAGIRGSLPWLPDLQGGELLDVVPGPDLGDHLRVGRAALGDLLAEFVQVVLMAWRGDEKQHTGWGRPPICEGLGHPPPTELAAPAPA